MNATTGTFSIPHELPPTKLGAVTSSGDDLQASRSRRILVVDDNDDAAASLAMLLELDGHETRVALSGADALAAVGEFEPHLVLLDIGLPDISGYEVARRVRALPGARALKLVALTGWSSDEDRRQTAAAGFDAHLVKPVDPARITELLNPEA